MTNARIEIASKPHYLEAWLSRQSGTEDGTLVVLVSPIVKPSNKWLLPIEEILSQSCSRVTEVAVIEDPYWMFGRLTCTERVMYATCPGHGVDHRCSIKEEHGGGAQAA